MEETVLKLLALTRDAVYLSLGTTLLSTVASTSTQ